MFVGAPRSDKITLNHVVNLVPDHENSGHGKSEEGNCDKGHETENCVIGRSNRNGGSEAEKD